MARKKRRRLHFALTTELETRPAKIVSEPGRVYMRPDDRKLVPLVAIDTMERSDIDALFSAYTPETVGDVAIQWGRRDDAPKGTVTLFLQFSKPVQLFLILDFEIVRQGILVDQILRTGEVYLQAMRQDEDAGPPRPSSRVRVVVPNTNFGPVWEELLVQELSAHSRALGASESQARLIAQESIRRWRIGPH